MRQLAAAVLAAAAVLGVAAQDSAGRLSAEAQRTADARKKVVLLEEAVRLEPTAERHMDLGTAYAGLTPARYADARREYRRAYELVMARGQKPLAALLLGQIAMMHAEEGHHLDAVKVLEAALQLAPENDKLRGELTKQRLALTALTLKADEINQGFATTREFDVQGPSIDLYVHFEFDSDRLTEGGRAQAEELGRALTAAEHGGERFAVIGHTDRVGSDEYNLGLSLRRAETVKRYLVERFAMDARRLTASGMGKRQPLQAGTSATDDAINRRVQVRIVP